MDCATVRKGLPCTFMLSRGCSYNGGICHEVVEQCGDCNRKVEFESGLYCSTCPDPILKWKVGGCNLATHIVTKSIKKGKINPLKASKRGNH